MITSRWFKKAVFGALVVAGFCAGNLAQAQERSYHYNSISITAWVNQDSTVDIEERQIFNYQGEYHKGWRSIPLQRVSDITNVRVVDAGTGQLLRYSSKRLNKSDPNSWGRYTVFRSGGSINVEWYYDLHDTTHEWIIRYRVHGGLSFLSELDELYWNLFTDYPVAVDQVEARVFLPTNNFSSEQVQAHGYNSQVLSGC